MKFPRSAVSWALFAFDVFAFPKDKPQPSHSINTLYVSADSKGAAHDGTLTKPFPSFDQAKRAVRRMIADAKKQLDIQVIVKPGLYRLKDSFVLSTEDSPGANSTVTWRAEHPGTVRITHAKLLKPEDWKAVRNTTILSRIPEVARGNVLEFDAKSSKIDNIGSWPDLFYYRPPFDQKAQLATLFFDGVRQQNGLFYVDQTTNLTMGKVVANYGTSKGGVFQYNSTRGNTDHVESSYVKAATEGRLWLQGWWRVPWEMPVAKVNSVDISSQTIQLETNIGDPSAGTGGGIGLKYSRPYGDLSYYPVQEYWALNLLEELQNPGQFVVDFETGRIYFWPPSQIRSATVEIADNTNAVISLQGASNIIISGFTVDVSIGDLISVVSGSNNVITRCELKESLLGGIAIQDSYNSGVNNSLIHNMGGGGVFLFNTSPLSTSADRNFAINNTIHDFAQHYIVYSPGITVGAHDRYNGGGGGNLTNAVGNHVAHNRIYNTPHGGILFQGIGNTFEYNDISNVCTYLDDMGGIYNYPSSPTRDNLIQYNYVHDIAAHSHGIYFDGSQDLSAVIRSNVMNRLDFHESLLNFSISLGRGINFNAGASTVSIYNNIVLQTPIGMLFNKVKPALLQNNLLISLPANSPFVLDRKPLPAPENLVLDTVAEVGFVDAPTDDYDLRSDSKVFALLPGFDPVPFGEIGLLP